MLVGYFFQKPIYVCIEFGTFVCLACSGYHRGFNRKVKGVGMGEFIVRVKKFGNEV
jgi:hypothetical protein